MHGSRLPKSSATATNTSTATSVTVSGVSQPELAAGQRQQGSFTGLPTTIHTPKSRHIPVVEQAFAGPRLLTEASASQVDPFQALAAHQTFTFDDDDQEPPDNSSSQFSRSLAVIGESSQPILDAAPNVKKAPFEIVSTLSAKDAGDTKIRTTTTIPEPKILPSTKAHFRQALSKIAPEAVLIGIVGDPHLASFQYPAKQSSDSINKWIISTGDADMPSQCDYEGCGRKFTRIQTLTSHIVTHTNDSELRCYAGDCLGVTRYRNRRALAQHIYKKNTIEEPYQCGVCEKRFRRKNNLKYHMKYKCT